MRYEDLPRDEASGRVLVEKVQFPISYTLLSPIGDRVDVEVREPRVLDLEIARKKTSNVEQSIAMFSNLMELTPEEVRQMSSRDFSRLGEALAPFF